MKVGDVVLRERDDGKLELGIVIDYCSQPIIETKKYYFGLFCRSGWEVIGEL